MGNTFFNKNNTPLNSNDQPKIELTMLGNWEGTIRMVQRLGPEIKRASIKAQIKVCTTIMQKVKAHIMNQDLGWRPLNKKYATAKSKGKGGWNGILLNYGTYYKNIKVWTKGTQHMVYVGVPKGVYTKTLSGKRNPVEVSVIAGMHEFARGRKLVKRPLWNPTISEIGGSKGIQRIYTNSLIWHLRKAGIDVTPFKKLF
jgi:hypothetical protein